MTAVLEELTAQLEYFDCFVAFNSGSDPDYYPGHWVIRVSDADPVSTLNHGWNIYSNHGWNIVP